MFNVHYHVLIFFIWSLSAIKFLRFDQSCELHAKIDVSHFVPVYACVIIDFLKKCSECMLLFKKKDRIRRSLSLFHGRRQLWIYQEESTTSRNALYTCMSLLIYHTFSVFNIHVFSCCLQNVYVLIVDNYVKTYVSVLFTIT